MTDMYAMFETDKTIEKAGFWYAFSKSTRYLLARAGGSNIRFAKVLEAKTRPHRRQLDDNSMDTDLANSLLIEAFVDAVLLDWEGVTGKDRQPLEYSKANAVKLLTDLPDLFTELRTEATRLANFLVKQVEDDSGN
jgi:hypothetical protein